jgi:alkanesulfonate monooxygenase SsuD/methylene tetrahydromethanopterin reductase-like flavin-dependent oxidoreductase (luciferase family)
MERRTAFGITASPRPDVGRLGATVEALGYDELWSNDNRRGDGLSTLAAAGSATSRLLLGVGVVALSEHSPAAIAERVRAAWLPPDRLTVGVGSGASRSLDLVRGGIAELRRSLPDHALAVAAVGPRMAGLAGEIADAVVANWAPPDRLAELRQLVADGAARAGRPSPRMVAYVRTAIGPGSEQRLQDEMTRYARAGAHYARALRAEGGALIGVAVESGDGSAVAAALQPYRAVVDTVVVRGLPATDDVDAWLEIARAVAPTPGSG